MSFLSATLFLLALLNAGKDANGPLILEHAVLPWIGRVPTTETKDPCHMWLYTQFEHRLRWYGPAALISTEDIKLDIKAQVSNSQTPGHERALRYDASMTLADSRTLSVPLLKKDGKEQCSQSLLWELGVEDRNGVVCWFAAYPNEERFILCYPDCVIVTRLRIAHCHAFYGASDALYGSHEIEFHVGQASCKSSMTLEPQSRMPPFPVVPVPPEIKKLEWAISFDLPNQQANRGSLMTLRFCYETRSFNPLKSDLLIVVVRQYYDGDQFKFQGEQTSTFPHVGPVPTYVEVPIRLLPEANTLKVTLKTSDEVSGDTIPLSVDDQAFINHVSFTQEEQNP